jgi:hypothetical protein
MSITKRLAVALVALLTYASADASAQATKPKHKFNRISAGVVLADNFPFANQAFVVQRRPDSDPGDIIVLRKGASAADLSEAVRGLLVTRQFKGDFPTKATTVRVRPQNRVTARKEFAWAGRVLRDVEKAEKKAIKGVGNGRMVVIKLPSQARSTGELSASSP